MSEMPDMPPIMLSGLTYAQAKQQAQATNCALRRSHWCSPVLVWENGRLWIDDDGVISVWTETTDDKRANDWSMVPREYTEGAET